jgi:uncharacterized protein with PQ loop repeat
MIPLTSIILVIAFAATLPQLYQAFKTESTGDFNSVNLFLNMIANALLGVHGYITRDNGILALGVWFTIYWSILFGIHLRK